MASKILVSDPLAEDGLVILRREAHVDARPDISAADLLRTIGGYDALIVRSRTKVTAQVIDAGTRLRVIGRAGVGVDNIDLEAATRRGIVVLNSPASASTSVAEHTIGLMLALARHIPQADASLRRGEWAKTRYTGIELAGKTLGIIGLGRIGAAVAQRARPLGMTIIAHDPLLTPAQIAERGARSVSLEELLRDSDFISVHTPLLPTTRGLIGAEELAMMKPTARLILCARGGIVDEDALLTALQAGRLGGAALDVFETEPPGDHPLLKHERVIATPHLGAMTEEAQVRAAIDIAQQVLAVLRGETVPAAVV